MPEQENRMEQVNTIRKALKKNEINVVHINFIGSDGEIYSKCSLTGLEKEHLYTSFLDGVAINGKMLPGWEHVSEAEWLLLIPDLSTIRYLPREFGYGVAFILGSFLDFPLDSRVCVERVVRYAESLACFPMCGTSVCYRLGDPTYFQACKPYQLPLAGNLTDLSIEIARQLHDVGISVEYFQPIGGGHNAVDLVPNTFLQALDQNATARWYIRSMGLKKGLDITFSSPQCTIPVCDIPVHLSLWNMDLNQNLFFDSEDSMELSVVGKNYIGGILHYFHELTTIIQLSAGTTYSKRWYCGYSSNRDEALVHVPVYLKERKKCDRVGWGKRILFNGFLQSCNLHLCAAAVLLAGLEGVRNHWKPELAVMLGQEVKKPCKELLKNDNIFRRVMGNEVIDYLLDCECIC